MSSCRAQRVAYSTSTVVHPPSRQPTHRETYTRTWTWVWFECGCSVHLTCYPSLRSNLSANSWTKRMRHIPTHTHTFVSCPVKVLEPCLLLISDTAWTIRTHTHICSYLLLESGRFWSEGHPNLLWWMVDSTFNYCQPHNHAGNRIYVRAYADLCLLEFWFLDRMPPLWGSACD